MHFLFPAVLGPQSFTASRVLRAKAHEAHFCVGATKVFAGAVLLVVAYRSRSIEGAGQFEPCSGSTA